MCNKWEEDVLTKAIKDKAKLQIATEALKRANDTLDFLYRTKVIQRDKGTETDLLGEIEILAEEGIAASEALEKIKG